MDSQTAFEHVKQSQVVAVLRGQFVPEVALATAQTLISNGVNCLEFTMNSPQALAAMQAVKQAHGDAACIGIGTVLDVETAQKALDAGADFVVSPALQVEVVQVVTEADRLVAPGVITPSEAVAAWGMGVKLLKLFPVGPLGVDYFKTMFGPLNHMAFMCNGGISAENAASFIRAGAMALGVAGWLTGDGTMSQTIIGQRAFQLKNVIRSAKGEPRLA